MKSHFVLFLVALFVLSAITTTALADPLNAKEMTLHVIQSGSIYVQDPVSTAAIVMTVPQNTPTQIIQKFSAEPETTEFIKDEYGNEMLKIKFADLKTGIHNYSIETVVTTTRKDFQNLDIAIGNDWLAETDHVKPSDQILTLGWRYRGASTLSDVAKIAIMVNSIVSYNADSKPRTPQAALRASRGDGISHAITMAALLRATGIPTRIVIGDAPLSTQEISNHAWVEVLAENNGETWIPFDSAFLRSASASYITKWAGPDLPPERMEFFGDGDVTWQRNPDAVEILDSIPASSLEMTPIDPGFTFAHNLYGWFGVTLKPKSCGFFRVTPLSCIDSNKQPVLTFHKPNRVIWACNATDLIWTFGITGYNYICPVLVNESTGASATARIMIDNITVSRNISISGANSVTVGTPINLMAIGIDPFIEKNILFYSPTLNERNTKSTWHLELEPGVYDFYLWFGGSLAAKTIRILEQREFLIALSSPDVATAGESIPLRIDVANLLNESVDATIKLRAGNIPATLCWRDNSGGANENKFCSDSYTLTLGPIDWRLVDFETIVDKPGMITLTASVENDRLDSAAFALKSVSVVAPAVQQVVETTRTLSEIVKQISPQFINPFIDLILTFSKIALFVQL